MAQASRRLEHNQPGDFFVDSSCIDCDTCRWMAPRTFARREGQSSVHRQPQSGKELRRALLALVACPTASIGTRKSHDLKPVLDALPDPIDEGVFHCGYHAESSFGAASYLIVRERGNVLIDSPRFSRPLVRRLEELGGVSKLFLTHRDDVADHAKFRAHFGSERILHERDLTADTRNVEHLLTGDEPVALDDEVTFLPVPGHTRGSTCLLYRDTFLFTGDHLAWSESRGHIYAFRGACWYRFDRLIESTRQLLNHSFSWILPGHGQRCHFPREEMPSQIRRALDWMEKQL